MGENRGTKFLYETALGTAQPLPPTAKIGSEAKPEFWSVNPNLRTRLAKIPEVARKNVHAELRFFCLDSWQPQTRLQKSSNVSVINRPKTNCKSASGMDTSASKELKSLSSLNTRNFTKSGAFSFLRSRHSLAALDGGLLGPV